jgi:hypothetical protein
MQAEEEEHDYDHCDKEISGSVGGGVRWTCTMPGDHIGYSHVACYIDIPVDSKRDQVLEIWGQRERSLQLTDSQLWVFTEGEAELIPKVHLPDVARVYKQHYRGRSCKDQEGFTGRGWVCSMPLGHRYSHIATASGMGVLAIWEKD